MEAAIITTYRCINRCHMCNIWKYPTKVEHEFKPELLLKLPALNFANVTGGEPFLRDDIEKILRILSRKAKRIVISTNGFLTDRIVSIAKKNRNIGFRISIEGLPRTNDELRGIKHGFDHGLRTLLELHLLGLKDIGFAITVSDKNTKDMFKLYQLAKVVDFEFATAVVHNSYYFHKHDNNISKKEEAIACFIELINDLLKTHRIKNWFRAYFNHGLINYIQGKARLLPCDAGTDVFFLDPYGDIRPCNGMDNASLANSMGNLNKNTFTEIWDGDKAREIREKVKSCTKNCWMIGTAVPAIKKNFISPAIWVIMNKVKSLLGQNFSLT